MAAVLIYFIILIGVAFIMGLIAFSALSLPVGAIKAIVRRIKK